MNTSAYPARAVTRVLLADVQDRQQSSAIDAVTRAQFLGLALQVGLVTLIIGQFRLEGAAFFQVTVLAFVGFLIHTLLPLRHRLPFFLVLSLGAIALVLGLPAGALLVGLGLALIGLCHLPISVRARVLLLLSAAAVLALLRANVIPTGWASTIWPILGSMFMFRLMVYLYDLRHEPVKPTVSRTLSYFFLLPNVCFPLFPVVDYKTFRRTYYDDQAYRIYQNGVRWIWRGVIHLMLYRIVYHYMVVPPADVRTASDLFWHLGSNFLLYLRVSGQFHLIVGMLGLFGFHLPETHHLYYLASSFTDFWRRINIYWKDFMMKLFYYPLFFKLRHRGQTFALLASTFLVFGATWLLHSYQWFWLRGSFPLTWQDAIFWGVLAVFVAVNALREAKYGRKRNLETPKWTFAAAAGLAFRTAVTFVAICVLWSVWTSESLEEWQAVGSMGMRQWLLAAAGAVAFVLLATLLGPFAAPGSPLRRVWEASKPALAARSPLAISAAMVAVYVVGWPQVYRQLGWPGAGLVDGVRRDKLSTRDSALLERGYYENLIRADRFTTQVWEADGNQPEGLAYFMVTTEDFLKTQLRPAADGRWRGQNFRTNQWGMRDKEYEKEPLPGAYRIALLGSSHVVGAGVAAEANFEAVLEERLNRQHSGSGYDVYEVLNFAVGGYGPLQELVTLEDKALSFQPKAVFYIAHSRDTNRAVGHLVDRVKKRVDLRYDYLRDLVRRAGVDENTPQFLIGRKLDPYAMELVTWVYRRIVELSRQRSIQPVWIYLPMTYEASDPSELARIARDVGFSIIDLSRVYEGHDPKTLWVGKRDFHPNVFGHRLIADLLYETLKADAALKSELLRRAF